MYSHKFTLKANLQSMPEGYPISAKIIADSVCGGRRITTFELVFPRYILAEFNTHRALSRNASSSRAIPTSKQISSIQEDPVFPVRWGKNKPGMQASEENLNPEDQEAAKQIWIDMVNYVAEGCAELVKLGVHKQWASRPLEWASTIKVVMTATELDNFFLLRDHDDAQDEIAHLAQAIKIVMNNSEPKELKYGQWHLPYIEDKDKEEYTLGECLKISASRCARTSYKTQLGVTSTLQEDLDMFSRLTYGMSFNEDNPFHASPTEHQATPMGGVLVKPEFTSNFVGWVQARKYIEVGIFDKIPGSNSSDWNF
jgi:hypothetical protein